MSGLAIYGSSCCMKTTITDKLKERIKNSTILRYSNGQIIDYYTDAKASCRPIDVLVGRAVFYNGIGSYEMQYPIFDRFLLDEYVWGVLQKKIDQEEFPIDAVYDWEHDLINDMNLKRVLLVNNDKNFLFQHCSDRLNYFGLEDNRKGRLDFIKKCDDFNTLFQALTYKIDVIEINSVQKEIFDSNVIVEKILTLVGE